MAVRSNGFDISRTGEQPMPAGYRDQPLKLEALTGISGWTVSERGFVLDLRGANISIAFARNLANICDYQFGCHTVPHVQAVGHAYDPKAQMFDVMAKIEPLESSLLGLQMPYLGPGCGNPKFQRIIDFGGDARGGPINGAQHIATELWIRAEVAARPEFLEVLGTSEAIRCALIPIAEQLREER